MTDDAAREALPRAFLKTLGGTGPDIVLVHGFGADRLSWAANAPALMEIGRVHAVDLPGHGEAPLAVGDGTGPVLAAAVDAAIAEAGLGRVHVVGHSLGGAIGLDLAHRRPERVASLVMIAPPGLGQGVDRAFLTTYPTLTEPDPATELLRQLVAKPILIGRMLVTRVLAQLDQPGARAALTTVAGAIAHREARMQAAVEALTGSDLPRLVVWGEADRINPLATEKLDAFGGERLVVPAAGHLPHVEAAAAFNRTVTAFLVRVMAAPAG